jgi:hypothetical protein
MERVEQALRPAVRGLQRSALAAEVLALRFKVERKLCLSG